MIKWLKYIFWTGMTLGGVYIFLKFVRPFGFGAWDAYTVFQKCVIWPLQSIFQKTLLAPYIYLALGFTLLLECLIPVNPKQKLFSDSFFQDFVWFFYETILNAIVITVYVDSLRWVYTTYFSFLTIKNMSLWPYWVRFALGVLLLDFLYWLQHYINHKVYWFWEFHTIHHSQKEINFFTDFRYHIFEYIVRQTILVIPFLIFAIHTPTVVVFSIVSTWYTRFYHGNVRTNLGPLRYVLVTPQSHRIHHSRLIQHKDQNFGSLFCIWDQIFKTQYQGYSEYPETGIEDAAFPHEQKIQLLKSLFMPLMQMAYPVVKLTHKVQDFWRNKG